MIYEICGLPKCGKTALMTYFAIKKMFKDEAKASLLSAKKEIEPYIRGGFNLSLPKKHLVYANYDIVGYMKSYPPRYSHFTNGWRLAFGIAPFETDFIPPFSSIFLMEAQEYYDCHKAEPCDAVSLYFARHGHQKIDIYLDCQRYDGLHKNIRNMVGQYIEVLSVKFVRTIFGDIKTVWKTKIFEGFSAIENYYNSGRVKGGKSHTFAFDGDIRRCYNAFSCQPQFFEGHINHYFCEGAGVKFDGSIDSLCSQNDERSMIAPTGFYAKKNSRKGGE